MVPPKINYREVYRDGRPDTLFHNPDTLVFRLAELCNESLATRAGVGEADHWIEVEYGENNWRRTEFHNCRKLPKIGLVYDVYIESSGSEAGMSWKIWHDVPFDNWLNKVYRIASRNDDGN